MDSINNEMNEKFKKLYKKKITKKITREFTYIRYCIYCFITIALLGIVSIVKTILGNDSLILKEDIFMFIVAVIMLLFVTVFVENKEFRNYSKVEQRFYLLFLLKDYINKNNKTNKEIEATYSIIGNYLKVLEEQKQVLVDNSPYKISKEELIINKIIYDFRKKVRGKICRQEEMQKILESVEILLKIEFEFLKERHTGLNIEEFNLNIQKNIEEYNLIMGTLGEEDFMLKPFRLIGGLFGKYKKSNKNTKYLLLTCIMIVIHMLAYYRLEGKIDMSAITNTMLIAIATPPCLAVFEKFRYDND